MIEVKANSILEILEPYLEEYQNGGSLTHNEIYNIFDSLTTEEWSAVENILDEDGVSLDDYITGVLEFELLIDDSVAVGELVHRVQLRVADEENETEDQDQLETECLMEEELKSLLGHVLDELPEEEGSIIRMHYGLDGFHKHSPELIAEELDLTIEEVLSLEAQALSRLKTPAMSSQLAEYKNFSK